MTPFARLLLALTLASTGCAPPPGQARVWTIRDFIAKRETEALNATRAFGGWAPRELVTAPGQPIPFAGLTQGAGPGLVVQPAFANGQPTAFVITDVWQAHPPPWVQPVYLATTDDARRAKRPDVRPVFPVGLDSTFYSPWWREHLVPLTDAEAATEAPLRSAQALLGRRVEPANSLIFCPIVPSSDVALAGTDASGGRVVRHPLTGAPLRNYDQGEALVDEIPTRYLRIGADHAAFEGQRLIESNVYVFVRDGVATPLPAVLPNDPGAHGFLRRVEVTIPAGAGVFVPPSRPDLLPGLEGLAATPPPNADQLSAFALRLARNPSCFTAPDFPSSCQWLDSEERLLALPALLRSSKDVLLSAGVPLP